LETFLNKTSNEQFKNYYNYDKDKKKFQINASATEKLAASGNTDAYEKLSDFFNTALKYLEDVNKYQEDLIKIEEQ
jgi:hypothetical protein